MIVGIPGTGLGGLFYILLVVFMPFRELFLTFRRRSNLARWRGVVLHILVAASILGVLWGEAWLLDRVMASAPSYGDHRAGPPRELFLRTGQVAALASFVVLAALLAGVTALSLAPVARDARRTERPARAPAPSPASRAIQTAWRAAGNLRTWAHASGRDRRRGLGHRDGDPSRPEGA